MMSETGMQINLSSEQQVKLEALSAEAGVSADELAREAIRSFLEYERWIRDTRNKVAVAVAEADRGELTGGSVVRERLRAKHRQFLREQS